MKKKILFICSNMGIGGVQKSLINLLMYMNYDEYDVDLLLIKKDGIYLDYINEHVNIFTFENTADYCQSYKEAVKRLYKRKKFGLLLLRSINLLISIFNKGIGAILMSKIIPKIDKFYDVCVDYGGQYQNYYMVDSIKSNKKISYFHNDYKKWNKYKTADKYYYSFVDAIITVSNECVKSLIDEFPQFSEKIYCIENIITKKTIEEFEKRSSIDEDFENLITNQYVFTTLGRVTLDKGVDLAIKTAKLLKFQYHLSFTWIWVGPGEIDKYQEEARHNNVEDCFIFVGGKLNPYSYLRKADIVIHPARFEGKAVAVEESLILNKPIIATDYSTVKDQLCHGCTGLIVKFDEATLAETIFSFLDDTDLQLKIQNYQKQYCKGNADEIRKFYSIIGDGVE